MTKEAEELSYFLESVRRFKNAFSRNMLKPPVRVILADTYELWKLEQFLREREEFTTFPTENDRGVKLYDIEFSYLPTMRPK